MNVRPADPRGQSGSEFHFSEQPQLSEELRMLREQVRRFVEREVVPHGEQWERDGKIPREIYRRMGVCLVLAAKACLATELRKKSIK